MKCVSEIPGEKEAQTRLLLSSSLCASVSRLHYLLVIGRHQAPDVDYFKLIGRASIIEYRSAFDAAHHSFPSFHLFFSQ